MSSVSVELEKQTCLRCNKQLRPIKNDFNNRKYHKKCHYDNQDELKFNFIKTTDWIYNQLNWHHEQNFPRNIRRGCCRCPQGLCSQAAQLH